MSQSLAGRTAVYDLLPLTRDEIPRFPGYPRALDETLFVGQHVDEAAVRARLDACLLDDSLAAADSRLWAGRPNPFPELRMVEAVAG